PALQRYVSVGRALPGVRAICPVIGTARKRLPRPIAARPTPPRRLVDVVHAGWHEVQKRHGVPLLLWVRRVGGGKRSQRAVAGTDVALQVKASRRRRQCRETVIPAFTLKRRTKGIDP